MVDIAIFKEFYMIKFLAGLKESGMLFLFIGKYFDNRPTIFKLEPL